MREGAREGGRETMRVREIEMQCRWIYRSVDIKIDGESVRGRELMCVCEREREREGER